MYFSHFCVIFAFRIQCSGLPLALVVMREESPGSIGRSTSETGSCRRRQDDAEENNRLRMSWVRVRRRCKRPPAGRRLPGCAIWRLQVRVNHRLRVVRPIIKRWRVERLSRRVICGVDKWQAPLGFKVKAEQNPAYRDTVFLFLFISVDLKEIENLEVNRLNNLMTVRRMKKQITRIIKFITVGIWHVKRQDVSPWLYFLYGVVKKLLLAIERATTKRMIDAASALTYSTLLAIVPIMAVVFAIARGFGYNKYIEAWFRDALASQPQAAEVIVGFVNSYLVHTKSGIFLGVGLIFMLWTVIMLINNIEQTFNYIWQVKKPRSLFRTITDYMAMFLLVPIIIVITSGISIFVATVSDSIEGYALLAPVMRFIIALMPYIFMSAVFIALYLFMPNTKVKLGCAIVPGILAGVAMQGLQLVYIYSQIWVSSYNAIYGSFAALPLFMLWVQISWTICLFGAELCYTSQNLEDFAFRAKTEDICHRYRLMLSVMLASLICKRFDEGGRPYTALELKLKTGIPVRIVNDLLYELTRVHIIIEVTSDEKGEESMYQPAESTERLSVGMLIDRIESQGKWSIELDMHMLATDNWKHVIRSRSEYLDSQREILLKDM